MKKRRIIFVGIIFCMYGILPAATVSDSKPLEGPEVALVFVDFPEMIQNRNRLLQNDPSAMAEYQSVINKADEAMLVELVTVMDKKRVPPSGDKHDYLSLAPYWWPDPDKLDGLPYIRHDGKVNPTTRDSYTDFSAKERLFDQLSPLAEAYFYSQEPRYRKRALEWLEAWFVDPATRMNPNLNYGQGIPGVNDGRCFGIIEWVGIGDLITPVQLLRACGALPEETDASVVQWFEEYSHWLQFSPLGQEEKTRTNNHGTWYDVQLTAILLFMGRPEEARQVLEGVKEMRIAVQIEPDGSQPREIERTKSLSYSTMNLRAFTQLAIFGKNTGVDLWNFETPDGRSIPKAFSFLKPYVDGKEIWPHQQVTDVSKAMEGLRSLFDKASHEFEFNDN